MELAYDTTLEPTVQDAQGNFTPEAQFLLAEYGKSTREIYQLIEHESHWYELKFYFVGLVVLGFFALGIFGLAHKEQSTLFDVLRRPSTMFVLSVATIVSLSIDMHIRSNRVLINHHGIWVQQFVEPFFLGNLRDKPNSPLEATEKLGWEQFLRIRYRTPEDKRDSDPTLCEQFLASEVCAFIRGGEDSVRESRHTSIAYTFAYWPHLHFMSILLYGIYVFVLVWLSLGNWCERRSGQVDLDSFSVLVTNQKTIAAFSFATLHISLLVSVFTKAFLVPDIFVTKIGGYIVESYELLILYFAALGATAFSAYLFCLGPLLAELDEQRRKREDDAKELGNDSKGNSFWGCLFS